MKKINLIISVALLSSLCIQAQSRKDGYVDKTIRQQADYAGVEAKANEAMWDFSDAELAGEDYRLTYFLWADSTGTQALCSEKGTRTGYVLRGDTLTVTGYRNAVTRMDYDEGEAWLHYPMTVGSALTGTFHGRGTYCDKLAMRSYGQYTTKTNRSTVDQLIKKGNGNYKVVETKLTEGTSKLSKGQEAVQEYVKSVKKDFLVKSHKGQLGLSYNQTIHVDEYIVKYKYTKK